MKTLLLGAALLFYVGVFAQSPVKFDKIKHSFGKITMNKPVTTQFTFTNISNKPVIIENTVAACGCTTPEYPKTPILKGKTGTIKLSYNAATSGRFNKTLTVKLANVSEPIVLTVDGEVINPRTEAQVNNRKPPIVRTKTLQ